MHPARGGLVRTLAHPTSRLADPVIHNFQVTVFHIPTATYLLIRFLATDTSNKKSHLFLENRTSVRSLSIIIMIRMTPFLHLIVSVCVATPGT